MSRVLVVALALLGTALAVWVVLSDDSGRSRRDDAGVETVPAAPDEDASPLVPAGVPREPVRDAPDDGVPTPAEAPGSSVGVGGRVLDTEGRPIAGATVFHGPASVLSDLEGRFRIPRAPARPTALVAVARGYRPARVEAARIGAGRPVDVVLTGPALTIAGVVVDAEGAPWPDVEVEIVDGTPCDATEAPPKGPPPPPGPMAEAVASGAESDVRSGPDGRFLVDGLAERTYLLRFRAPGLDQPQSLRALAGSDVVVRLPVVHPGQPLDGLARSRLELGKGD